MKLSDMGTWVFCRIIHGWSQFFDLWKCPTCPNCLYTSIYLSFELPVYLSVVFTMWPANEVFILSFFSSLSWILFFVPLQGTISKKYEAHPRLYYTPIAWKPVHPWGCGFVSFCDGCCSSEERVRVYCRSFYNYLMGSFWWQPFWHAFVCSTWFA